MVLLGATYFIYNFFAYFSGVRSFISMIFGLLLAFYLIFSGLDKIFLLEQTRPRLYKYVCIAYMIITVIFFIVSIVVLYISRQ